MGDPAQPLPSGWGLVLDARVRRTDAGRTLVGGWPRRVVRLTPAGAGLVERLVAGSPVPRSVPAQSLARRLLAAGLAHPRPGPPAEGAERAGEEAGEGQSGPRLSDVTLVVPVRDRAAGLARTLAAAGPVGAVVVVDDGSVPAQARATAEVMSRVARGTRDRLVRHDRSLGPAAARNRGWALATTEVVTFLDADCEPEPGWLAPLLAHLGDPAVGAVAPRVVAGGSSGCRPRALAAYERKRSPLDMGPWPAAVRPGAPVPYVPSAALVVRRRALALLGGFDPALGVGEDVDLVWRLVEAGWTVRYEPAGRVVHPPREGLAAWLSQRLAYGRSAGALHRRHPGRVPAAVVARSSAAAWALAGSGHPWVAAALAVAAAGRLANRLGSLDHPWREAALLAWQGHVAVATQLAAAARRPWWPLALPLALASARCRRALLAAAVIPPLGEWALSRPGPGPCTWVVLRLLDDVAYGAGVWAGCRDAATGGPLWPSTGRG